MSSAEVMTPRSLLEEMLDSLRRRDKGSKDSPPALPVRPTSKGRLPSTRRSLPLDFKVDSKIFGSEKKGGRRDERGVKNDKEAGLKSGILGSKRVRNIERAEESPYFKVVEPESFGAKVVAGDGLVSSPVFTSPAGLPNEKLGSGNAVDCVLKKKLRVWCKLSNGKWELGKVQSISGDNAGVLLSNDKVFVVSEEHLLPANPVILDGVDDLIWLSYLNAPSILHNLKLRYSHDMIYSKAGPILIAINPFKDVPLYGDDYMAAYKQKGTDAPHVYAIADTAFNEMMRGVNQSIIISGESGAGKTETAKVAMQYLAALGGGNGIECEVLQTNCILEAFGNAKTCRNDNSSRFGKLIDIHFSPNGKICGAKIQTFLLEKSRVVRQAKGERSYHVFYQLCAGARPPLKERLNLKPANEYEYLKQSECLIIDDVDDAQKFLKLMEALDIVAVSLEDQENAFAMLAAILWLGDIKFSVIDNENHVEVILEEGVTSSAKLLGCEVSDLMLALSTRKIRAGNESIVQKLTLQQAIDTRDAMAKCIYASLFDWLVEQINKSLEVGKSESWKSISILDIYGFESFQKNSFEQFCINYANERLQQHFNRHLFKLEQEEYTQDGIDWANIDFPDNADCLNLFEKKPLGLLSLLDEESTFPKATDVTLADKFRQHLNSNPCFKGEKGAAFRVRHYAGQVLYDTTGFLEKNRDPLHSDCIQLLLSCSCRLPKLFASLILNRSQKPVGNFRQVNSLDSYKQSVGTKFKGQLFMLMQRLANTAPHFIRCIKPNSKQLPDIYENELVLQQLRCCGVLEVVRISRSGYPTRLTHQQFADRYGFILLRNVGSQDPLSVSVAVLQQSNILPEMYQVGYTKLFLRPGQVTVLEDIRNHTMHGILVVQKYIRRLQAHRCFQYLKNGAIIFQSLIRGWLTRKHLVLAKYAERSKLSHLNADKELGKNLLDMKDNQGEHPQVHLSSLADLQRRLQKAHELLRHKEVENSTLQQKLQQYELKMKSMEEMWRKQVSSLQESLAAAKKVHTADGKTNRTRKLQPIQNYYDSEDGMPSEAHAPQYARMPEGTPPRFPYACHAVPAKESNGMKVAVSDLAREFEQQKKFFDDDAGVINKLKAGKSDSAMNPREELRKLKAQFTTWKRDYKARLCEAKAAFQKSGKSDSAMNHPREELQKLKTQFTAWKRDYKARLREAKAALQKFGHWEGEKARRKWWAKMSQKTQNINFK